MQKIKRFIRVMKRFCCSCCGSSEGTYPIATESHQTRKERLERERAKQYRRERAQLLNIHESDYEDLN